MRRTVLAAGGLALSVALAGCTLGVRQLPAPGRDATGRPPTELVRLDAAAVSIFNAALPHNATTLGASAQSYSGGGSPAAGTSGRGTPWPGTAPGRGTGIAPGPNRTGAGTGTAATGTTTGTPSSATGSTGTAPTNTGPGTSGGTGTGANTGVNANPGAAGATGPATPGPATGTGATAQPGPSTPRTPSTAAPAVDWTRINQDYSTIQHDWTAVRGAVQGQGAQGDLLTAADTVVRTLGEAVRAQDAPAAARAANDLTGIDATMIGLFRQGTPVAIYTLEYLAREVQLDSEEGRSEAARDGARAMGGVWATLRGSAMARSSATANAVDADVARLQREATDGAALALRNDAGTLLRDLHTLTRSFVR
jgi:hypothetical protein